MKKTLIGALLLCSLLLACGTSFNPPTPEVGVICVMAPDTMEVSVDGVTFGTGTVEVPVVVNYPNYLQVGPWKFVLWPPVDYTGLQLWE